MHRTRSAEGDQRVVTRIMATLDGNHANGLGHVGRHDVENAVRGFQNAHIELFRKPLDGLYRQRTVNLHSAVEQIFRVVCLKYDIGVSDRRLVIAKAVAGRTRIGACRTWTDFQVIAGIDIGDRATTGPDRVYIEHRSLDRITVDHRLVHHSALTISKQCNVRAGTAHVKRDEVVDAGHATNSLGSDNAGRGTGQNGAYRHFGSSIKADNAAIRLGELRRNRDAEIGELAGQRFHITLHDGAKIGIDDRGRQSLELTEFRRDTV